MEYKYIWIGICFWIGVLCLNKYMKMHMKVERKNAASQKALFILPVVFLAQGMHPMIRQHVTDPVIFALLMIIPMALVIWISYKIVDSIR